MQKREFLSQFQGRRPFQIVPDGSNCASRVPEVESQRINSAADKYRKPHRESGGIVSFNTGAERAEKETVYVFRKRQHYGNMIQDF